MNYRRLAFKVTLVAVLISNTALAADTDSLKSADNALIEALNRHDISRIAAHLHDGLVHFAADAESPLDWATLSAGERRDRLQALFAPYKTWRLSQEDGIHYRVFGDTGVVSGVERIQSQREKWAEVMIRQRFTRTWQQVDGKWLLIGSHRSDFAGEALTQFPLPESDAERKIIEFGTSTGYSGLWFANALRKTGGK